MESYRGNLSVVLITLAIIHIVQAQDQSGFLSLDCGLPSNESSPYKQKETGLWFYSDESYVRSGETARVKENPANYMNQYQTLRYFPVGLRNCYNLTVEKGRRYLIRATFVYGNYDGRHTSPVFDLYLGPNLWTKIDLRQVNGTKEEILHIPTSNSLQICLVMTGNTTPLISTLELRPTRNGSYNITSVSLRLFTRRYLSKSTSQIRYSEDVYDRIWDPYFQKEWTQISTVLDVKNSNNHAPPQAVLKNAAIPTNASMPLRIKWSSSRRNNQYFLFLHLAEIQDLHKNETRQFNILFNGQLFYGPTTPIILETNTVHSLSSNSCNGECNLQLTRTNNSTLPPLLNAYEIYTVISFPQSETDESDVVAMENIKDGYGLISKINWQGDPCVPQQLN